MTLDRRDIAPEQWRHFFDAFSRTMRGQRVTVNVHERQSRTVRERVRTLVRDAPLGGIAADEEPDTGTTIEIMVGDTPDTHVVHCVQTPTRVQVLQVGNGHDTALCIESSNGTSVEIEWGE